MSFSGEEGRNPQVAEEANGAKESAFGEMPVSDKASVKNDVVEKKAATKKAPAKKAAGTKATGSMQETDAKNAAAPKKAPVKKTSAKKKSAKGAPLSKRAIFREAKDLHKTSVSDEVMIRFSHVTKVFKLYKNDRARFMGLFNINRTGKYLGEVKANDDLSFEIKRGEAVAFLGLNGAGKSTALKMITGVMYPTSGTVEVNGRVSALLELSAGFDSKLTGRENIHLRGQILGMTREEIDALMPGIEEFAELGVYFDQPMKTYSSGMRARLGFSFAVSVNPEILVVDEALSVGDKVFRRKCLQRIREIMMDENVTVLFVTHSSSTAQQFCSRGIVLDKGTKVFEGTIEESTAYYEERY